MWRLEDRPHFGETVLAINGPDSRRLERYGGFNSALSAGSAEALSRSAGIASLRAARSAAGGATLGFVGESFRGKKFLFTGCKCKWGTTVRAGKRLVS